MQGWHTTFLGVRELPRDISDFETQAFFTFDGAEREAINARRGDAHKLGMALHIGFFAHEWSIALFLAGCACPLVASPQRGTWHSHPRCRFATHFVWP